MKQINKLINKLEKKKRHYFNQLGSIQFSETDPGYNTHYKKFNKTNKLLTELDNLINPKPAWCNDVLQLKNTEELIVSLFDLYTLKRTPNKNRSTNVKYFLVTEKIMKLLDGSTIIDLKSLLEHYKEL